MLQYGVLVTSLQPLAGRHLCKCARREQRDLEMICASGEINGRQAVEFRLQSSCQQPRTTLLANLVARERSRQLLVPGLRLSADKPIKPLGWQESSGVRDFDPIVKDFDQW